MNQNQEVNYLVTGAANGIGLEYVRMILRTGGRVVMTDVDVKTGTQRESKMKLVYGEDRVTFLVLDVRDQTQWNKVWDEAEIWLGSKINVLMNNAGVFSRTNWKLMNDINMTGMLTGTMVAIERMGLSNGGQGGTVVQTASLAGLLAAGWTTPIEHVYTATKHAIVAYTRGLGDSNCKTWKTDKVRVMAVCPWVVNTDLVRKGLENISEEELSRKQKSWVHRFMEPWEVADSVEHLLITGKTGDVLTVGPDETAYIFPSAQQYIFLFCKLCHTIFKKSGILGDINMKIMSVNQIMSLAAIILFFTIIFFHYLLCFLGF